MIIEYEYQIKEISQDKRFVYDDDCGQYKYCGKYFNIVINTWNRKVNVYYVNELQLLSINSDELKLLNKILNMCV